jgi:hypothetical protein
MNNSDKLDYGVFFDVRFGSKPAAESNTWRVAGFGQKQPLEITGPRLENHSVTACDSP